MQLRVFGDPVLGHSKLGPIAFARKTDAPGTARSQESLEWV